MPWGVSFQVGNSWGQSIHKIKSLQFFEVRKYRLYKVIRWKARYISREAASILRICSMVISRPQMVARSFKKNPFNVTALFFEWS